MLLGAMEGSSEGMLLGATEGSSEGNSEGVSLGSLVGLKVGKGEGKGEGGLVGTSVGPIEGLSWGIMVGDLDLVGVEVTGAVVTTIVVGDAVGATVIFLSVKQKSQSFGQASLTVLLLKAVNFRFPLQNFLVLFAFPLTHAQLPLVSPLFLIKS